MRSIAAVLLVASAFGTVSSSFARPASIAPLQEGAPADDGRASSPSAAQAATPPARRAAPAQDAGDAAQHDPTQHDEVLQRVLDPRTTSVPAPARPVEPLPALALRGLVVTAGGGGAAMIEVGDALYRVDAHSVVRAASTSGSAQTLRVRSIDSDAVTLEVAATGEVVVLR